MKRNFFIFIILYSSFFIHHSSSFAQCPTCQLPGWQFVREITIDNSAISTSYTNYQELIFFDSQSLISQGKMNSNGSDIRFVDSDCSTQLCYYIESGINTTNTKIWVKLPSLAANSTKTIFMFYGNATASSQNNFSCVFPSVLTVNSSVTLSGNQNYDWIEIQPGGTVNIGTGQLLSFKARKIIMSGTINGNNAGYGPAAGPGAGGNGGGGSGGGGGGYGGKGGSGGCPAGNSGSAYGTANGLDIDMGSGGGGSDCAAAASGGGAVKFEAGDILVNGNINVNGQSLPNQCCCGNGSEAAGGGAGGGILIQADYVNGNGTLNANGGKGQNSDTKEGGGGGGGGRIKIFYCKENNFAGTASVNKGQPGSGGQCSANDADDGTFTSNIFACASITIANEQFSPVANAGPDMAFCSGSSVTIGADSVAGYTYSWSPSAGLSNSTVSKPTVIITNNGSSNIVNNYILSATYNGCTVTDTVQVTVFPLPTSDFTAVGPVCVDENLMIQYTGNADTSQATFIWDFDNGNVISSAGQDYIVSWDTSGQKNISLTVVQNGCISSLQKIIITVNPPNANAGPDVSFCSGSTVSIGSSPNANYTYSWSPSTGLNNNSSGMPLITLTNTTQAPITTDYILTTSFAGCSHTDTVAVTVNPEPVSDAGQDINNFCSGSSALIGTLNNPNYTYLWSPSTGLNNPAVSSPMVTLTNFNSIPLTQTYVVTTTFAAYGCTTSDSMVITVYQIPTTDFSAPDSVCIYETATISYSGNATSNASFQWNFGGGNASPGAGIGPHSVFWSVSGNVIVTLNVTEICSSASTTSKNIYVKPLPVANAGNDVSICSGNSAPIGVSPISGYSYLWSPTFGLNDSTISNPTVNNTNNSQIPFVTDYVVTATLQNCISTDTVKVTVYQIPTSVFNLPTQLCGTEKGIISYIGNATSAATFNWNFDAGIAAPGNGTGPHNVYWQTTGMKYISLSVTENGCSSGTTVDSVMVYPIPAANAGNDFSMCSGNSAQIGVSSTSGYSYLWIPSTNLSSDTISNPVFTWTNNFNSIDSLQYVVIASANNCSDSDTVKIAVIPNPDINFTANDSTQCLTGNNFSFFSSGTYLPSANFNWNFGANATPSSSGLQNVTGVSFQSAGTHLVSLIVTNSASPLCSYTFESNAIVYPMPTENGKADTAIGCEPLLVNFYSANVSNLTYLWNFGDGNTSALPKPKHTFYDDGIYNVYLTITSQDGCDSTFFVSQITVNPKPVAAFSFSPEKITNLNPVVNFSDESFFSIKSWKWNFGDGKNSIDQHPSHFFQDTGNFITTLIVTNEYGCLDTISDTILILPDYNFFIPNAFSPNDDGQNDKFMPIAIGIDYSEFEMLIYNRWGELIYVTQSAKFPWDGTFDGKPVPQDVYVWMIVLRDVFRKEHHYVGRVTVVR